MIAVYLSPLYFLGTWLLAYMFLRWLSVCGEKGKLRLVFMRKSVKITVFLLTFCLSLMIPAGFLLKSCRLKYILLHMGSIWLGVLLYGLLAATLYIIYCLAVYIIVKLRLKHGKIPEGTAFERPAVIARIAGAAAVAAVAAVCIIGVYKAGNYKIKEYSVNIQKETSIDELNAVMIADIHLGYNIGCSQVSRMVKKINECNPDIVFICGDIFDNDIEALDDIEELERLLRSISSGYGVYACYGNHDIDEKILAGFTFDYDGEKKSSPAMIDFLKKSNIHVLSDEGILIDDAFYVFGRRDYSKPGNKEKSRITPDMIMDEFASLYPEKNYPVIVLDHEPKESKLLDRAGCDLVLSGHTHDGQIFPGNILLAALYENSYGYKKYNTLQEIVTSGAGLFGPYMRVGTDAEICRIKIRFR